MGLFLRFALLSALCIGANAAQAGCYRWAPIQDVKEAVVPAPAGKPLTAEQVLREHTAEVEIPYSVTSFSVLYRSSINLNAGGGEIHKNYNGWVQNLAKGINAQTRIL